MILIKKSILVLLIDKVEQESKEKLDRPASNGRRRSKWDTRRCQGCNNRALSAKR